ncbi:glycosyltransferase [Desulfurococcus amylolyticus]|uniref:glycosyltransferase n=1 Tax=Desulfurococcus amylolyticus TaxID=94694 RepID=UPI001F2A08CB|nr:glycosyltransferase family 2 protein [Desulfurococcus amylolyticus]
MFLVLDLVIVLMITLPQLWFYIVYAVFAWRAANCRQHTTSCSPGEASISFIIPVRREPLEYLEQAVEYIHGLGIRDYEIIIVSDDDEGFKQVLFDKLHEWRRRGLNVWIIWRSRPVGYRTGALNTALWLSRGDYIYVLDVDSRLDKCLLDCAMEILSSHEDTVAVVGRWEPLNLDARLSEALGYSMRFIVGAIYHGRNCMGLNVFPLGTGTLFKSRYLKEILNGWDQERIQDDMEIGSRIMYHGLKVRYLSDCAVYVENPSTYKALRIQQSRWAYGATDVLIARWRHILGSRQGVLGKIEAILFLSQYIVPSIVFLGTVMLAVNAFIKPFDVLMRHTHLIIALAISQWFFGRYYYREVKKHIDSSWGTLVNMGRSAAVTTALSPYYLYSTLKALLRIRVQYARTPKGMYQLSSSRIRIPWELILAVLYAVTGIIYLLNNATLSGLWLIANSSAYSYVVYRWRKDVFFN